MADALCGPTSALSSLQKHTQKDRSLQQDRLTSRQAQHQHESFRSSPGPSNHALVDAEFEAFQQGQFPLNGVNTSPLLHQHHHHHQIAHSPPGLQHAATAPPQLGLPSWASDFQQLNIHEARHSPIPAVRFRQEAPLQRPSGSNWHEQFMRNEVGRTGTPPAGPAAAATFGGFAHQQPFMSPMSAGFSGGMHSFGSQLGQQQQQQQQQQMDMFDDAAFAAAFDNAAAAFVTPSAEQQEEPGKGKGKERAAAETQHEQFSLDHACVEPPEPFFADIDEEALLSGEARLEEQQREINAAQESYLQAAREREQEQRPTYEYNLDTGRMEPLLHDDGMRQEPVNEEQRPEEKEERMDPELEADELSRTAGQLLDNLKHEQGEKFANSNFMALMRQLRDREVRVEGDGFVENTAQALHPGGPTYPHDAFQHLPPRVPE